MLLMSFVPILQFTIFSQHHVLLPLLSVHSRCCLSVHSRCRQCGSVTYLSPLPSSHFLTPFVMGCESYLLNLFKTVLLTIEVTFMVDKGGFQLARCFDLSLCEELSPSKEKAVTELVTGRGSSLLQVLREMDGVHWWRLLSTPVLLKSEVKSHLDV